MARIRNGLRRVKENFESSYDLLGQNVTFCEVIGSLKDWWGMDVKFECDFPDVPWHQGPGVVRSIPNIKCFRTGGGCPIKAALEIVRLTV